MKRIWLNLCEHDDSVQQQEWKAHRYFGHAGGLKEIKNHLRHYQNSFSSKDLHLKNVVLKNDENCNNYNHFQNKSIA